MPDSVRQQILEAIRDAYVAVAPASPVNDDDWPFAFSTVAIGPLTEPDHRKRYSIGVVAQAEREDHLYPYIVCFLRVGVEFRVTVNREDDAPAIVAENVLTVVKRVIMANKGWGGLALDTQMAGNEIDLTSYGDRTVMGVQFIEIQYRHGQRDPRDPGPSI